MKRLLLAAALLLSSVLTKAQLSDTTITAIQTGVKTADTFDVKKIPATVKLYFNGTLPSRIAYRVSFTMEGHDKPLVLDFDTTQYQDYMAEDGYYVYRPSTVVGTGEKVIFAFKFDLNGDINSFGVLKPDHTILVFFFQPYLKEDEEQTSKG